MLNSEIQPRSYLTMVERVVFMTAFLVMILDVVLAHIKGVGFFFPGYAVPLCAVIAMYGAGLFYRLSGRSENLALAFIGAGGMIFFSASLSTLNYLFLPVVNGTIDPVLAEADKWFGVYWPDVMQWAADHPTTNSILRFAYMTTLPQLATLIIVCGFAGNRKALDTLSLSLAVSGVFVVAFWGVFPSLGAKCFYEIPQELWAQIMPVVDFAYAQELILIGKEGVSIIDPTEIRGLVAFPSYHVTLAVISLAASWHFRWLFPICLVLNLLILPATMIHGGHHFVDPFGGLLLFVLTHLVVKFVLKRYALSEDRQANVKIPVSS